MESIGKESLQELLTVRQIKNEADNLIFCGTVEDEADLLSASEIAMWCPAFSIDDEDEVFCGGMGVVNCFNCRYRRWLRKGFECVKGLLHSAQEAHDCRGNDDKPG